MKRSSQVALLLMGATSVGAGAYALTPPRDCVAPGTQPAAVAPAVPGQAGTQPCSSIRSASSGTRSYGAHWSRPIFSRTASAPAGGAPQTGRSSVPSVPRGGILSSQRGGFGSIGRAFSSSS